MSVKSNNSGAAMVIAVCVMAIITALCLSLLLYASVLLAGAQNVAPAEQCRVLAVSLSKELERQITGIDQTSEISTYLRNNVWTDSWPYFNEEERGHTGRFAYRYFELELPDDVLTSHTAEVMMYWESEVDAEKDGTPLFATVTCSDGKQRVSITNEFHLDYTEENGEETWIWGLVWRE